MGLLSKAQNILNKKHRKVSIFLLLFIFMFLSTSYSHHEIKTPQIDLTYYDLLGYYKPEIKEPIKELYGIEINEKIKGMNKQIVIDFYTEFTGNETISESIINWALYYNVPIHSCFGIAWAESRFRHKVVGKNYINGKLDSRDWGLFQLNDGYRNWTKQEFFNIDKNTKSGIATFTKSYNFFIESKGISFAYLGYNMGIGGANRYSTIPNHKINYVDRISTFSGKLDNEFNTRFRTSSR